LNWQIKALIIGAIFLGLAWIEKQTGMIGNFLKSLGTGLGTLGTGIAGLGTGIGKGLYGITYYPLIAFPQALLEWKRLLFGDQTSKQTLVSVHSPMGIVTAQELGLNKSLIRERFG
jgi:hypothetical protein